MNIESLKCFILVAENLSFARAAEALYKTQPAVTKQINALEQEIGVPLFIRSTRHVELTPAGMSFYKDAKELVQNAQIAVERAQKQNVSENIINIGLSNPTVLFHLIPYLSQFHKDYPTIYPNIQVLSYKIIISLFMDNKLDILFMYKENMSQKKGVSFKEIQKDSYVCLLPSDHVLSNKEKISVYSLENDVIIICNPLSAPLSTASFQNKLLQQHSGKKILYCDSIEAAHCMVASGMGIAILPKILCMKSPDFVCVPLEDSAELSFGVFYHQKNPNTALKNFLRLI